MNLPELPSKFQDRFEVAKAKAELQYTNRAALFSHNPHFAESPIHNLKLIQDVLFAYCTEARNAGRGGNWTAARVRRATEAALPLICDSYYSREHANCSDAEVARFRVAFRRTVNDDPQWKQHLSELAALAEKPTKAKDAPSAKAPRPATKRGTERRSMVDAFLLRCNEEPHLGVKLIRKHIRLAIGHKTPRQFQYWQARSAKSTPEDDRNFRRILAMKPAGFVAVLRKKGIIS
jgi:hypothetical protein